MSPEQLAKRGPGQGVVCGSIAVRADLPRVSGSAGGLLTPLLEFDSAGQELSVRGKRCESSAATHQLVVPVGSEIEFAAALDAGQYCFCEVLVLGTTQPVHVRVVFDVEPGTVRYIGRLVVRVADVIGPEDAMAIAVEAATPAAVDELCRTRGLTLASTHLMTAN